MRPHKCTSILPAGGAAGPAKPVGGRSITTADRFRGMKAHNGTSVLDGGEGSERLFSRP